jgi:hypothetical protein
MLVSSLFYVSQNLYGWDSWVLPSVVLSIIALIEYYRKKQLWIVLILGALTAVAGLCRLPSYMMYFFIVYFLFTYKKGQATLRNRINVIILYTAACAVSTTLILAIIYGNPLEFKTSLDNNMFRGDHGFILIARFFIQTFLYVCICAMVIACSYYLLLKRNWSQKLLVVLGCLYLAVANYLLLRGQQIHDNSNVQSFEIAFILVTMYVIYYNSFNKSIARILVSIGLLSCVPFIGSNTGVVKAVTLPVIPILYVYGRQYFLLKDKIFAGLCFITLLSYSYIAIRNFSYCDAGAIKCKFEFREGLAKGIWVTQENGDSITRVVNDFRPYCESNHTVILRNGPEYIYEYLLNSRNDYLKQIFCGANDDDVKYVAWAKSEIENNVDNVAILRFGDCDRPSRMTEMLNEYCTKSKIGDGYTIYVKIPKE